ncbi:MAG: ketopantoate reductase family protein [Candidatus Binataceae bacterium]|nr:ketopantoate reductase family protein [Candidatus Binataceae bacterium]
MKILVMGAGTIGAYYGARIQQAGEDVTYCVRGANLRAMREHGIEVISIKGDFTLPKVIATENPVEFAPYDLILLCVKSYHTEEAARKIIRCLQPGCAVLTLQNGVENESILQRIVGADAVISGNARIFADMPAPGKINHTGTGYIEFGELDGRITNRVRAYAEVFERAGILGELTSDIFDRRWDKLIWNNAYNTVTTITGRNLGLLHDDPDMLRLMRRIMEESIAVARAEGAKIADGRADWILNFAAANLRDSNSSTLQDLGRGRRLEYDAITGAVIRAARRHGIAVPITEALHALIKLRDPAAQLA